jgi:hypothetical protein
MKLPNVTAILKTGITRDTEELRFRRFCKQAADGLPYRTCETCGDTIPEDEDCCD